MAEKKAKVNRRGFLAGAATAGVFTIVPRHVLGGPGQTAPSDTFGAALIGCGGRGPKTLASLRDKHGLAIRDLARCDVKYVGKADNKTTYTDFRRVLERKDVDIVAIATPPHWHALISIAAMAAGKDVLCEKPMTRTIAEGRGVVKAAERYGRIFQIGTYARFGLDRSDSQRQAHKLMASGLVKKTKGAYVRRGGFKVRQWSGKIDVPPIAVPSYLDWDLYCGPSPLKPFVPTRVGGTHRWYWDYEGGGLTDMGEHHLDGINWLTGKDATSPVEVETSAPPAHPEVTGMWGWSKMTYADGSKLVLESGEWGEPTGLKSKRVDLDELSEADQEKLAAMPDPEPLVGFGEAVKTRQQAGGHAEAAHRTVTVLHLTNISIRVGRKIKYDPVAEQIIGDEEANRLVNQPMRAPWHL
jgi:myo-inositol 2-dehydrogenase / D-chiro-inositol 1-dehydrogenase